MSIAYSPFVSTHLYRLSAAVIAAFGTIPALADTSLAPVVVTATRQATRSNELLADVTVIGREEIEQTAATTVEELLSRQPGIQFAANGGPGTNSSLFIRGSNSNHTVLLVDGLRVGSATSGTPTLSRIPLAQIERIEILRGPASSLYGADALGGIVQIFTKKGEGPARLDAMVGAGSHGTFESSAGVSGGTNVLSYNLQAGYYRTDGFSAVRNPASSSYNPDRDGYRNANFSGSFSVRPAAGHEYGINAMVSNGLSRYDSSPKTADFKNDEDISAIGLHARNRITDSWTSTLRLGQSVNDATSQINGAAASVFRTRQNQAMWQNDLRLPVGNALLAAEYLNQRVDSTTAYPVTERTIRSILAGWKGNLDKHRLQVNLRRDDNSQFGGKTTGFAAYGYQFTDALRGHASYGTAFRAPTFNELYFPDTGFGSGNPNLKPETSKNAETGITWEQGLARISAVYYHNKVHDLINGWPPANVSRATLEGVTLAYDNRIADWTLAASLDLGRPRDDISGKRLARRADEVFNARLSRAFGAWNIGGEWQLVGDRFDDAANTKHMGGYGLLNLIADYRFDRDWQFFVRANNVFDKKYELARDFATPGASVFAGIRYSPR